MTAPQVILRRFSFSGYPSDCHGTGNNRAKVQNVCTEHRISAPQRNAALTRLVSSGFADDTTPNQPDRRIPHLDGAKMADKPTVETGKGMSEMC
ncbi:MAG: hypothetical protein Q7J57_07430 [Gemmobacter sp.]|nr:hypothetical protein [Gemmobacter sp.]